MAAARAVERVLGPAQPGVGGRREAHRVASGRHQALAEGAARVVDDPDRARHAAGRELEHYVPAVRPWLLEAAHRNLELQGRVGVDPQRADRGEPAPPRQLLAEPRHLLVVIAGEAEPVAVAIELVGVRDLRAVVDRVDQAVAIVVAVARIAQTVTVVVAVVVVGQLRA